MNIKRVFIIGYPKSGNTWLTRLLARCLNAPVGADPKHAEIATDVNHELKNEKENLTVYKLHTLPKDFDNLYSPTDSDAIIVISRNPLDVFISSFFYFKYPEKMHYVKKDVKITLNPIYYIMRSYFRSKLNDYIDEFTEKGLGRIHTLSYFSNVWHCEGTVKKYNAAYVTYEDLLEDTTSSLRKILKHFNLENIDQNIIQDAINSECFNNRKQNIEKEKRQLTFGKKFNRRFLRSGTANDYKNYLTEDQIKYFWDHFNNPTSDPTQANHTKIKAD